MAGMDLNPYQAPKSFSYQMPATPGPTATFSWRRVLVAVVVLVGGTSVVDWSAATVVRIIARMH